jgi:hypothetical protein
MNGTIEATIRVDEIIDQIDTDTLIEEINDRGGVAGKDWTALFDDNYECIEDMLNGIRDAAETEEIISWLKREGYRVTNADDDVIVIKRRKLELAVDYHIVTAVSQMTEQTKAMKDVLLATALKSSEVAINDIIAELTGANKEGEE